MIEEALSNKTVVRGTEKPRFYEPKSYFLNTLHTDINIDPKESTPHPAHALDEMVLGEPISSCKLCPWYLRHGRDPWTREPEWTRRERITNLQNQLPAVLCSGSQWCTAHKLRCCCSECYLLPAWQEKLSDTRIAFLPWWPSTTSRLQYYDDKSRKHLFEPLFGNDSWTYLLNVSFVSLLVISSRPYQDLSHLWCPINEIYYH